MRSTFATSDNAAPAEDVRCALGASITAYLVHSQKIISQAAADFQSALRSEMPMFSFTVKLDRDVPVQDLRPAVDRMAKWLKKTVENRREHVLGSLFMFESVPALADGAVLELEHAHYHCLIGLKDETAPALRNFRSAPDFQKVESVSAAQGWIEYGTKSQPIAFAGHWDRLLAVPQTFAPRLSQLKKFRITHSTGLFHEPRGVRR